jgi:hypothetical protein
MCERKEITRKQKANKEEEDLRRCNGTKMDKKKYRKAEMNTRKRTDF